MIAGVAIASVAGIAIAHHASQDNRVVVPPPADLDEDEFIPQLVPSTVPQMPTPEIEVEPVPAATSAPQAPRELGYI